MSPFVLPSFRRLALLEAERVRLQAWLDCFESPAGGAARVARLARSGEYLVVNHFPLPDAYQPDQVDLLLLTDDFPARPPIGLYLLEAANQALLDQLRGRMNAFPNAGFHGAPGLAGYTWLCWTYRDLGWRYCPSDPGRGDNLTKFLASFFAAVRP